VLFVVAMAVRFVGLGVAPAPHATDDEYFYLWSGMSMMEGKAPKSWSLLKVPDRVKEGIYYTDKAGYFIVQPALDHPPLFEVLTGAAAKVLGAKPMLVQLDKPLHKSVLWDISLGRLGLLPLGLFAVGFWLMWGWLRLALGAGAALGAMVVFSCVKIIVLHQRLVVPDNLIVPAMLLVFWTLERWRRGCIGNRRAGWVVSAGVAVAVLSKLVGLCVVPAVFAWAGAVAGGSNDERALDQNGMAGGRGRRWWPCAWAVAGGGVGLALAVGWGAAWDFEVFKAAMRSQSSRFMDFGSVFDVVRRQPTVIADGFDRWMVGGWLLLFMGLGGATGGSAGRGRRSVAIACIGFLTGFMFFSMKGFLGWHLLPFFPFLCAAWGVGLRQAWMRPQSAWGLVVILMLLALAMQPWFERWTDWRGVLRYAIVPVAILALWPWGGRWDGWRRVAYRIVLIGLLAAGLGWEVYSIVT
jgi:hypothetical protein